MTTPQTGSYGLVRFQSFVPSFSQNLGQVCQRCFPEIQKSNLVNPKYKKLEMTFHDAVICSSAVGGLHCL